MHLTNNLKQVLTAHPEIFRFVLVGILATVIHYAIYLILNLFIITWIAYSIGYLISFLFNFYLSSIFTFKSKATIKTGNEDTAENSVFIFSPIENCKLNNIYLQDYLKHLFECILHDKDCCKKILLPYS